jgi:hypothetical protein
MVHTYEKQESVKCRAVVRCTGRKVVKQVSSSGANRIRCLDGVSDFRVDCFKLSFKAGPGNFVLLLLRSQVGLSLLDNLREIICVAVNCRAN